MENKRTPHFQFCLETAFLGEKHTKSMEWKAPSPGSKCSFSGWYASPGLLTEPWVANLPGRIELSPDEFISHLSGRCGRFPNSPS